MKIGRWILATVVAVVAMVVLTGCPNPLRPPAVEPATILELVTDPVFQARHFGPISTDDVFTDIPLMPAGGAAHIEFSIVDGPGGQRSLQFRTMVDWGAGIDLRHADFGFEAGNVVHISGEILELAGGRLQINRNIGGEMAVASQTAAGPFDFTHTIEDGDMSQIVGGSPAGLRLEARASGMVVRIDNIRVEGYRPIGWGPPPPPPPPPPQDPLSISLQYSADRFVEGETGFIPGSTTIRRAVGNFAVTAVNMTYREIFFDGNLPGGAGDSVIVWANPYYPGASQEPTVPSADVPVIPTGNILLNQQGMGSGTLTLSVDLGPGTTPVWPTSPTNVPAGFHEFTMRFGGEEASSWFRVWPTATNINRIMVGELRGDLVYGVYSTLEATVIGNLPGSGVIHFSNDNVIGLPEGIYASGTFSINADGLGLGNLILSGNAEEDGLFSPIVRLHGFEYDFTFFIEGVLYSLVEDDSFTDYIGDSPWLATSGSPTINVTRGEDEDGDWIRVAVSDRAHDSDTIDVMLAGNILLPGEFAITMTGVTTPGAEVRFMTYPNFGWQPAVIADEDGEFEVTSLFSFDGATFTIAGFPTFNRFRLFASSAPFHDFIIHTLEIYPASSDD